MHWLLNVVCDLEDNPAAVLIRGMEPIAGLDKMRSLRPQPISQNRQSISCGWTDGPAKLCQALAVSGEMNGVDLCDSESGLWITDAGRQVMDKEVIHTPRIGLNSVPEPWRSIPWRFLFIKAAP
jgi:DNA-3-methyladenine glycosylase